MASIALLNEIAEINGEKQTWRVSTKLNDASPLGSGCFSSVWADPESEFHVIKCGGGDVWANYAAYCIDNPENEHLPRINFLKVVNGRYVAQIERLHSVDGAKGPDGKQIGAWCMIMGCADKSHDSWDYLRNVHDHPLWHTLYDINEKIGRTRDLSYRHNMMMRSDGTLVVTDPIADELYQGVNKYSLAQYNYDGYIIPERAHSNERYMVRKEVRYTQSLDRSAPEDRSLQTAQSIAVCDARTGQVLGLLPSVPRQLHSHDGACLPERYTATEVAEKRRKGLADWAILEELQRGVPDNQWKNFILAPQLIRKRQSGKFFFPVVPEIARPGDPIVGPTRLKPTPAEARAAQRLHIRNLDPHKVMAAQGRVRR
jgi:hypothetical protein